MLPLLYVYFLRIRMSASLVWFKRLCLSTIPFPCCSSAALFCSSYFFAWEGVFGLARASLPCRSVLPLFYPLFLATRVRPSPSPANVHRRPSPLPANVHRQQATNAHTNAPSFDAVLHTQTHQTHACATPCFDPFFDLFFDPLKEPIHD